MKYKDVYNIIKKKYVDGAAAGTALKKEKELASASGVNRKTVRRALADLKQEGIIYSVKGTGTFVAGSASGRRFRIAVVLPMEQSNNNKIMDGALESSVRYNIAAQLYITDYNPIREKEALTEILSGGFDGVLGHFCDSLANIELISRIRIAGVPITAVDDIPRLPGIHCVVSDGFSGMKDAASHLIKTGVSKIAYIAFGGDRNVIAGRRFLGYCAALSEHNIPVRREYTFFHEFSENIGRLEYRERVDIVRAAAAECVDKFISLADPPEAYCAINDMSALAFAADLASRFPEIYAKSKIIGFDGISENITSGLSTVAQDFYRMGKTGVKVLYELMSGRKPRIETLLPAKLVVRSSDKQPFFVLM